MKTKKNLFFFLMSIFALSGEAQLKIDSIGHLIFGNIDAPVPSFYSNGYDWHIRGYKGLYWSYNDASEYNQAGNYFLIDLQGNAPRIASSSNFLSFVNPETGSFSNLVAKGFLYPDLSNSGVATTPLRNGLATLSRITPLTQNQTLAESSAATGFSTEQLESILPNTIYKDSSGKRYVDYMQLVPYLVDAIKSLQAKIISQQDIIGQLQAQAINVPATESGKVAKTSNAAPKESVLYQNAPNPATTQTTIAYYLAETAQNAYLLIHDVRGSQVAKHELHRTGNSRFVLNVSRWNKGIYFYSLIVDGKLISTKKLEVN